MYAAASCSEMTDQSGRIRSPWGPVMGAVRDMGEAEVGCRAAALNRRMPLAGPFGTSQHYDPLPAPLTALEFAGLEAGLRQRAQLLNLVLEDLYERQMLLREGYFPPALVFGNPHFLRGMHTAQPL